MAVEERDPVSGQKTTGHEWNGIKELDTPVPLGVLIFIVVTHVWALLWWILMPTCPLVTTYTKGILGTDQRKIVEQDLIAAQAERAAWMKAIETASFEEIQANEDLMKVVRTTGHQLFGDNCAACHGADGRGRANYPDLTDDDWLWGGGPEKIAETMQLGINSRHQNTRVAQMPAFGRDAMLDRTQVTNVATYVQSLSNPAASTTAEHRADQGRAGDLPHDLRGLPRRGRQGQPGGRRPQPDRSVLGLRRRPPDPHRHDPWRAAGAHADLGRAPDPGGDQDPGPVRQLTRGREAMTGGDVTKRARWPLLAWSLAAAVLLVVAAANAHLVYVAVESQPECVAHLKEAGAKAGEFRAAKPAC